MKVIIFGATGMVGQGILRECLLDSDVNSVLCIGRSPTGTQHPKLRELVRPNLMDYSDVESQLAGFDACFFTLGVSSVGMAEDAYRRITYDITLAAARTLARLNPDMTFIYVSGAGTDSTEQGRVMWARVKGKTENDVLKLPFKAAYIFRPGVIIPLHGIQSRTALYRIPLKILGPILPALKGLFPRYVTSTEQIGRAMLKAARTGAPKRVLESIEIDRL
uniref:NAD-dependent epimerase/dehydratase domain-containing protein n=1 Tax=Solibacter usitatus (strain Ellin6076) TaxID=234267 RepID=Q027L9_SOLUE